MNAQTRACFCVSQLGVGIAAVGGSGTGAAADANATQVPNVKAATFFPILAATLSVVMG